MDKRQVPESCLTDEVLWELAFRLTGGDTGEAAIASEGGPSESIPGDFFLESEESVKEHLHKCDTCRNRLKQRVRYVREYSKLTNDPDVLALAETIVRGTESSEERKILTFCPYEDDDDERHHAFAAQTESRRERRPLRFLSEDEELMLRTFEDEQTGACTYYLTSNDPRFVKNATIVFNGKRYYPDPDGRIDFGDAAKDINEESEFLILL